MFPYLALVQLSLPKGLDCTQRRRNRALAPAPIARRSGHRRKAPLADGRQPWSSIRRLGLRPKFARRAGASPIARGRRQSAKNIGWLRGCCEELDRKGGSEDWQWGQAEQGLVLVRRGKGDKDRIDLHQGQDRPRHPPRARGWRLRAGRGLGRTSASFRRHTSILYLGCTRDFMSRSCAGRCPKSSGAARAEGGRRSSRAPTPRGGGGGQRPFR